MKCFIVIGYLNLLRRYYNNTQLRHEICCALGHSVRNIIGKNVLIIRIKKIKKIPNEYLHKIVHRIRYIYICIMYTYIYQYRTVPYAVFSQLPWQLLVVNIGTFNFSFFFSFYFHVLCFVLQLLSAVANDLDYMLTDLYDSPPTTLNR